MFSVRKSLSHAAIAGIGSTLAMVMTAIPAAAHVDVEADKAQAGATDVTVSFAAESESSTAGIISLQVALPTGIAPADVTLVSAPAGWTFAATADGYTVSGPALPAGQDAEYQVKIAKLPADVTTLPFKTIQSYAGGQVDRWIEIPRSGAEPENPAPMLSLAPAAPAAAPQSATTTTEDAATTTPPSASNTAAPAAEDNGTSAWIWVIVAAVVVLIAIGAGLFLRRRRASSS